MTIFVGYWLHVVHNWLYIAKYGAKSDYITHARYIKNKNVHSRGDGENCRQLSLFSPNDLVDTDCYWFDVLSVSKASKAESAIPPVNWWEGIDPQFSIFSWSGLPDVKKLGSEMLASESEVCQTWINVYEKKIHQLWVSILFLTFALDTCSDFPADSTPDGRRKRGK